MRHEIEWCYSGTTREEGPGILYQKNYEVIGGHFGIQFHHFYLFT